MELDPDYTGFVVNTEDEQEEEQSRLLHENARDATVGKIRSILDEQFSKEIEMKENELMTINQKLADARSVMDRLRACVVASFYAASFTKPVDGAKGPAPGAAYHPAIQNVMRKAVTSVLSKNSPPTLSIKTNNEESCKEEDVVNNIENAEMSLDESAIEPTIDSASQSHIQNQIQNDEKNETKTIETDKIEQNLGGRQRIKKTIVIGNVSKYIPPEQREGSDKSTHKWMVYVRGSKSEPRIDHFVRKVWFFLHPSYRPNDLVEVCESPFHLTRRGWGEFPIRVQIHFCDRRNRPVDIIHGLRLDRSYTGLQTLGAETVCEVELDKSSVQLSVDEILSVSDLQNLPGNNVSGEVNAEDYTTQTENNDKETELVKSSETEDCRNAEDHTTKTENNDKETESVKSSETEDCRNAEDHTKQTENNDKETESVKSSETKEKDIGNDVITDSNSTEVKYSDQHQFQPVTTSCTISADTVSPSRKRKLSEEKSEYQKAVISDQPCTNIQIDSDNKEEENEEEATPHKKRRKRRRDNSIRMYQSEDEILSDTNEKSNVISTKDNTEQALSDSGKGVASEAVSISRVSDQTSHKAKQSSDDTEAESKANKGESFAEMEKTSNTHGDLASHTNDKSSSDSQSSDSLLESMIVSPQKCIGSSDSTVFTDSIKQPIFVLPRSPISSSGFVRVRSVSANAGIQTSKLEQSDVKITSVNVEKTAEKNTNVAQSSLENVTVHALANVEKATGCNPSTVTASKTPEIQPVVLKKEVKATHFTVPLSSLLKATSSPNQPQTLKIPQSLLIKGGAFTVNTQNVGIKTVRREKRSFSADQPARTLTLATPGSGLVPLQLRIISPPHALKLGTQPKKLKTSLPQSPVTLQTLKAVLSSGKISTLKPVENSGQQQYILTTVVNPKGRQQLALIKPSTLSLENAKKIFSIPFINKGTASSNTKQLPLLEPISKSIKILTKDTKSKEQITQPKVLQPIYKVIGDQVDLSHNVCSIVDDILPHVAKLVPLVSNKRNLTDFPFSALTENDFLDWNVGKQRAAEWQRASLIRRVLIYIQSTREKLQNFEIPSKKFIMNWCLRHGYSVFTDEYEEENMETEENEKIQSAKYDLGNISSTKSTNIDMLKLLESKQCEMKSKKNDDDDDVIFVDVVTIEDKQKKLVNVKEEPADVNKFYNSTDASDASVNKITLLQNSVEVNAVEEISRKIGVNLPRSTTLPVSHMVLAKALQQFVGTLLRKSVCASLIRRDGKTLQRVVPDEIKVMDVVSAINETPALDFITDSNTASDTTD